MLDRKCLGKTFATHPGRSPWRPSGSTWAGLLLAVLGLVAACGATENQNRAAFVLVDISGQYASEIQEVRNLTNVLLADLDSGDSMGVAFIDNSSFSNRNIIARADFDRRPSVATQQKRQVRSEVDDFLERFSVPSYHSDITGGILLAQEFFRESEAGQHYLFVLSDLQEDLKPDMNRDMPLELEGVDVVAVNVKRHRSDNYNPAAYEQRLDQWRARVEEGGGEWHVANDLTRLERMALLR